MLAVRMQQETPLFCHSICGRRWSKDYFKGTYRTRETVRSGVGVSEAPVRTRVLSQNERYNKAFRVAQRLCAVVAELPFRQFSQAMNVMEDLAQAWENGRFVELRVFNGPGGEPHRSPSTSLPQTCARPEPSVSSTQAPPAQSHSQTASASTTGQRSQPRENLSDIRHIVPPAQSHSQTASASTTSQRSQPHENLSDNPHILPPGRSHSQSTSTTGQRSSPRENLSDIRRIVPPGGSHSQSASVSTTAQRSPPRENLSDSDIPHIAPPGRSHSQSASVSTTAQRSAPRENLSDIPHIAPQARSQTASASAQRTPPSLDLESGMSPPPHADLPLSDIQLPSRMKRRGRPKGSDITVIGLPKQSKSRLGPMSFAQRIQSEKEEVILGWLVPNLANNYREKLLSVADLPKQSGHLPLSLLDENVDVVTVQKFFDRGAWLLILSMIDNLRKNTQYSCTMCQLSLGLHTQAIVCDACLLWFHIKCETSKGAVPKGRFWFCRKCRKV
ncbi:serine/arginine repetitive matrix protein 2-like [Littorina saxatilis]|uniref:serine/arginine repetitive matrix protein 2-like n=1 Tax=Littorina saxatilis TaxID=31220 RepID=UPI0038B5B707